MPNIRDPPVLTSLNLSAHIPATSHIHKSITSNQGLIISFLMWNRRSAASAASSGSSYEVPWTAPGSPGLRAFYWMDAASLMPALLLGVGPGMAVLDM